MQKVTKVKCELCGREISMSNYGSHLRRHKIHPETFKSQSYALNHAGLSCQFCGIECKNSNSLCNHERLCKLNPNRQVVRHPGTKGIPAWNKGLTKETDARILRCSENLKRRHASGELKTKWPLSTEEAREKHRNSMKRVYSNYRPMVHKHFKQGNYMGIPCDSSWELAYLLYCLDHNVHIERNKRGFAYIWGDSEHRYFPDFYLPDIDTYVEIKGYKSNRDISKIEQFQYKLKVLERADMKPIISFVETKYGKDFVRLYNSEQI